MSLLVAGLINLETTLRVEGFPLDYQPVRYPFFGVNTTVSGVGYNLSKALTALGHQVRFLSLVGRDQPGAVVYVTLQQEGLPAADVLATLDATAQSVIIFEPSGRRMIHTDLKDIQEQTYPRDRYLQALADCDLAVLCNINFTRQLLAVTREQGVPIATDVHTISRLDDPYNRDYLAAATILFQSHEHLPASPQEWIQGVYATFGTSIIVVGLGRDGALLGVDGAIHHVPAVVTRPVVNTIGAGDALFASFLHEYHLRRDPYTALQQAVVFASWKIGANGGASGFLNAAELYQLSQSVYQHS